MKKKKVVSGKTMPKKDARHVGKVESEMKKSKKVVEIVENTKKTLAGVINSKEFRDVLKDNFEDFKVIFQELSKNQITTFKYLLKLGQILNKRTENSRISIYF